MKNVALVLLSVTEISYIMHIVFQIHARFMVDRSGISKRNRFGENVLAIARRIPSDVLIENVLAFAWTPLIFELIQTKSEILFSGDNPTILF